MNDSKRFQAIETSIERTKTIKTYAAAALKGILSNEYFFASTDSEAALEMNDVVELAADYAYALAAEINKRENIIIDGESG